MNKLKNITLFTMIMLALTMIAIISCYAASNGAGNEPNHGFAVSDGTYIYYSVDGNLYRENVDGKNIA